MLTVVVKINAEGRLCEAIHGSDGPFGDDVEVIVQKALNINTGFGRTMQVGDAKINYKDGHVYLNANDEKYGFSSEGLDEISKFCSACDDEYAKKCHNYETKRSQQSNTYTKSVKRVILK